MSVKYQTWTNIDLKFLEKGILPKNRSVRACRVYCKRHNIKFCGKKKIDENNRLLEKFERLYNNKSNNQQ